MDRDTPANRSTAVPPYAPVVRFHRRVLVGPAPVHTATTAQEAGVIEARGLTKRFGGTVAVVAALLAVRFS